MTVAGTQQLSDVVEYTVSIGPWRLSEPGNEQAAVIGAGDNVERIGPPVVVYHLPRYDLILYVGSEEIGVRIKHDKEVLLFLITDQEIAIAKMKEGEKKMAKIFRIPVGVNGSDVLVAQLKNKAQGIGYKTGEQYCYYGCADKHAVTDFLDSLIQLLEHAANSL